MKIERIDNSKAKAGKYRWRTRHANGEIGVWSEHYRNRADREHSIELHQAELASAPSVEVK
jgi:uncharacterized protein YegP (UPF0339 family)